MKLIALVFAALIVSPFASADIYLKPALSYSTTKSDDGNGGKVDRTRRLTDIALGSLNKSWSYYALYASDTISQNSSTATLTGLGVGLGYFFRSGFYLEAAYYIQATQAESGATYKGTGWQADLGWKYDLTRMSVGAQFSDRNYSFNKGNGNPTNYKQSNLDPLIVFMFVF